MEAFAIFLAVLFSGVVLYFLFTDPVSFLLFALLLAILFYVLVYFGFISATTKPDELDITYRPTPVPSESTATGPPSTADIRPSLSEVFYVANNIFSYDQAPAVCSAYGGELASYDQVETAYNQGAEWCGYGWTSGGIALFPTQEATWKKLQTEIDPAKKIACGRPGINGGYFDPITKFGVNCYGIRPQKKPGAPATDKAFAAAVARMKGMLGKLSVYPFSKSDWSEYTGASQGITSAETKIQGLGSEIGTELKSVKRVGGEVESDISGAVSSVVDQIKSIF